MRTRYAIISISQAHEVGLDPSTLRMTEDGESVIVTEAQITGLPDVPLYTREEIITRISDNNTNVNTK